MRGLYYSTLAISSIVLNSLPYIARPLFNVTSSLFYATGGLLANSANLARAFVPAFLGALTTIASFIATPQFLLLAVPLALLAVFAPRLTLKLISFPIKLAAKIAGPLLFGVATLAKIILKICMAPIKFMFRKRNNSRQNTFRSGQNTHQARDFYIPRDRGHSATSTRAFDNPDSFQPHNTRYDYFSSDIPILYTPSRRAAPTPIVPPVREDSSHEKFSDMFAAKNINLPMGHKWVCPISADVANDPVRLFGQLFDRHSLARIEGNPWNDAGRRKCPLTRRYFTNADIIAADDVRTEIQKFIDSGLDLDMHEAIEASKLAANQPVADVNNFSKIFKDREIDLPDGHRWVCPISLDVMDNPVKLGEHFFDREPLIEYLERSENGERDHPITRVKFTKNDIQDAGDVRKEIQNFIDSGLSLEEYEKANDPSNRASLKI